MTVKALGAAILVIVLVILGVAVYRYNERVRTPPLYSPKLMLLSLWEDYKKAYIDESGRTVDRQRDDVTTSEGQSYTMLRSVWMDDRTTFDTSWQWTKDVLQRDSDRLFSWLFGETSPGRFGVLTSQGGANAASDADLDIALALIFAHARWGDPQYLTEARAIMNDIWKHEVVVVQGVPYLASDNVENASNQVLINPSYFSPATYRIFAKVDTSHDWMGLVDSAYDLIEKSIDSPLDTEKSIGLPPDWFVLNTRTGELTAAAGEHTTNFGFDALRIPWRIALDYEWHGDDRAKKVLGKMKFLDDQWSSKGLIHTVYSHDGRIVNNAETPAFYGGTLGYFMLVNKARAEEIQNVKLRALYSSDQEGWRFRLGYYDDNWAWFGLALYHRALPNLAADLNTTPQ